MNQGTKPVRTASKDILARCMATEDINVVHCASVPTAFFDTESRTLGLPVWKEMDDSVYDMLVGHEVSHALHTPASGWQDFIGKGKGSQVRHAFVNVVEDARIERKIKDKFPGLRRDFASAYKTMHQQDKFEIAGVNVDDLPLLDRLNIHFKVGLYGLEDVSFSADEQQYVTRMAETESFEEVIQLAKELYEKYENEREDDEEQQQDESSESQNSAGGGDEDEGEGEGEDSDESSSDSSSGDESSNDEGDESGESSNGSRSDDNDENGEDSGASSTDDTDDGESAESQKGEAGDTQSLEYGDYSNDNGSETPGFTQHNYEKAVSEFRDDEASDYNYHTLPDCNLNEIIIDHKKIATLWNDYDVERNANYGADAENHYRDRNINLRNELNTFSRESKAVVNHMVQQFMQKKAADADRRTSVAKTGILDTVSMIDYRWSEDIFRKNEIHHDGDNHGLVLFLDWSGSMQSILQDTIKQLLILVEFCRKVGIPYEVYAFSSNIASSYNGGMTQEDRDILQAYKDANPQFSVDGVNDIHPHEFQLYNFLSSTMNTREYNTAVWNLWRCANGSDGYRYDCPRCLNLGCTPLNEAIIAAIDIVPEFQRENNVQIVNTVFLTDGDGHKIGISGSYWGKEKNFLRDKKTRKTYEVEYGSNDNESSALLQLLKDRTGTNTIGIRLHNSNSIKSLRYRYWQGSNNSGVVYDTSADEEFEVASVEYRKNNFAVTNIPGYDLFLVVKGNLKVQTDALDNLDDDASYAKIKNAFMKGNTSKKSSRVIATQLVDIIAV